MTLHSLLIHPLTAIVALSLVLIGIGTVSPEQRANASVSVYSIPSSQTQIPQATKPVSTKNKAATRTSASTAASTINTSATSSSHYSVPSSLRGDEGGGYDD